MVRACFTLLALLLALPVSAQPQLKLDIRNGLVTMSASNVPVRQVLAEWARVGGTKVVGAERIAGAPLTLSLEGVPEAKALDIVLRGAAGFVAAPRQVAGSGVSIYDRILVLATSTPPASGAPSGAAANRPAGNRFGVPPAVEPEPSTEVTMDAQEIPDAPVSNPFANAFGQAAAAQGGSPFGAPQTPFGQPAPFGQPQGQQGGFFQPLQPPQQAPAVMPQGFFGNGGAAVPGMIQQPQPAPVQAPFQTPRPRPQG